MLSVVFTVTTAAIALVVGLVSVELGAEFFAAVNTALNLVTILWVRRTRKDTIETIQPKVEHIAEVAEQLDTAKEGGRRSYDPPSGFKYGPTGCEVKENK